MSVEFTVFSTLALHSLDLLLDDAADTFWLAFNNYTADSVLMPTTGLAL